LTATDTAGWTVGVRPERADDVDAVERVHAEVVRSVAGLRGGEAYSTTPGEFSGPEAELSLVGTIGPVVVGALRAGVEVDGSGSRICTIRFIGVEPAARGVGVGRALLTSAREWARGQGASALDSTAFPGDRSTKNFFEAHGMVARLIVVRTSLA
jgi:GNAT superfamily N-acetyltransferase